MMLTTSLNEGKGDMRERLHHNQSFHQREHSRVDRELDDVRDEVRSSAQTLAAIGENLIVALRRFDSRLTESSNGVSELAERARAGEQQLSELKSAVKSIQRGLEQNCQAIAELTARLEGYEPGRGVRRFLERGSEYTDSTEHQLQR
jgi:chromosome segregation ATPase